MLNMLHNELCYELRDFKAEINTLVNYRLNNSELYQRICNYIKIANDNSERLAQHIRENNSLCYEKITKVKVSFNKESLLTSAYEIHLCTYVEKKFHNSTNIGLDVLIVLLAECELIED